MRIDILTLFPEMFSAMQESIVGRAQKAGKIQINIVNIRDYTEDKHLKCDDYPFGGGAGMVMMAPPIGNAIEAIDPEHKARRIYMSPKGQVFKQQKVFELLEYVANAQHMFNVIVTHSAKVNLFLKSFNEVIKYVDVNGIVVPVLKGKPYAI